MKTVVSYAYYETPQSAYNLDFFSQVGIINDPNILFIIVINGEKCCIELPDRDNCIIICRPNIGFDFGAHNASIKYLLKRYPGGIDGLPFDNFIFMNSGVIGPFLPTYYPSNLPWTHVFTSKLNDKVKLVGTSLVCFGYDFAEGQGPHIEGFCFCLDKVGLDIIILKGTVFVDHQSKVSAINNGEYGLSKAILEKGYGLNCLLYRYQNIDWQNKNNWFNANNSQFSSRSGTYDGISIHPFEVVFHKWHWAGHRAVSFDFVDRYKKWKLSSINKTKKVHVTYGQADFNINVTDKFIKNFVKNDRIIIPAGCSFSKYFVDTIALFKDSVNLFLTINGTSYTLPNKINTEQEFMLVHDNIKVYYGKNDFKINITNKFINSFRKNDQIIIPKDCSFNMLFGDFCPGRVKEITLDINNDTYIINENHSSKDLVFDINNTT